MQEPFDNIVQHLFRQPSLHSVTVDELENMATQHPYFAAAQLLLLKKMQDIEHPQFNTQLHKTTLYFNNPLWLQYLLQPEHIDTSSAVLHDHVREADSAVTPTTAAVVEQATEASDVLPHAGIMDVISSVFEETDVQAPQTTPEPATAIATNETWPDPPVIDDGMAVNTGDIAAERAVRPAEPMEGQDAGMPQENSVQGIPVESPSAAETTHERLIAANTATIEDDSIVQRDQQDEMHTVQEHNSEPAAAVETPGAHETIHEPVITDDNAPAAEDESIAHDHHQEELPKMQENNSEPAASAETPAATETMYDPAHTEDNTANIPNDAIAHEQQEIDTVQAENNEPGTALETETRAEPVVAEHPEHHAANTPAEPDGPDNTAEIPAAVAGNAERPLFKTVIETAAAKNDFLFEPYHTVDYFASQGIKLSKMEADSKDKLGRQLKSFTEWLKTMKKLPQVSIDKILSENEESKVVADAIHSIENKEVITEAMAEVFEKQGMADKAVEVYQKLSLLNPAKSAYFAAKIAILKH